MNNTKIPKSIYNIVLKNIKKESLKNAEKASDKKYPKPEEILYDLIN